jgi:hypothetical protein
VAQSARSAADAASAPRPVESIADVIDRPASPSGPAVRPMGAGPTPALEAGQFRGSDVPDWGIDVSAAQLEQDTKARGMLERANEARLASIRQSEELRGDPMEKQVDARRATMAYEGLMPFGSVGSIRANYGGNGPLAGAEIGSEAIGERQPGIPTIAQVLEQQARSKPEDQRRYQQDDAVGKEMAALNQFSQALQAEVQAGRRSPQEADALFTRARDAAAFRIQAVRGDTLAAWGPQKEDPYGSAPLPIPVTK